ncbi:MAG: hypothetical protein ACYTEL_22030, partial [Planctomycetota bacterium]
VRYQKPAVPCLPTLLDSQTHHTIPTSLAIGAQRLNCYEGLISLHLEGSKRGRSSLNFFFFFGRAIQ